ncbi:MFS transporter [Saccharothrix variisporea]|uniref:Putative MFS family arabinose efflux permease n=1 Tax=Saccharothrix variisporea TaxID=543527 RepID=A0A495XN19_9PSEU|nr:MFS transporter [Saccharothrix variisporea]RKT74595.1 putative MFS family arabinose efflux permease [Saccharothrix variisporea]
MSGRSDTKTHRGSATVAPPEKEMPGWGFRIWAMLIVVCGAFMLDALDNIMVGIATPPIQAEFGMSNNTLQWVVSAYVLGFGGFLLLGGRAADLAGRRRVFLVGVTVFAVGSLLGGLGDTSVMVIAGRFIMGVGAAFTAPSALSIIITSFPAGAQRNRALGIYTACGAVGYSTGVIVGGLLTELGWRWTFLLPVPIVVVVFLGGLFLVPKDPAPVRGRKYDVAGAVTITAAMLLLVFAIVEAPASGLLAPRTAGAFVAAIVLIGLFVAIERRAAEPLLRLALLRVPSLVGASLVAAAILGTYMSFQFIGGLYLQSYLGWSPLQMGLAFLPVGLLIMTIAPRAGKLIGRFGLHGMIFAGFVAYTLSYALFLRIDETASYWWVVFPSVALIGIAFPFSFPAANVLATSRVADDEQGVAAGILQTGYQVGAAIVLAVIAAISTLDASGRTDRAAQLESYHTSLYVVLGISVLTTVLTLVPVLRAAARKRTQPVPAAG